MKTIRKPFYYNLLDKHNVKKAGDLICEINDIAGSLGKKERNIFFQAKEEFLNQYGIGDGYDIQYTEWIIDVDCDGEVILAGAWTLLNRFLWNEKIFHLPEKDRNPNINRKRKYNLKKEKLGLWKNEIVGKKKYKELNPEKAKNLLVELLSLGENK